MEYVYCTLIGYLIGCFNPSFLLGRIKGVDIKKKGSGNAGASNALILFGKLSGIICALLDILKAYLAIKLTEALFAEFALSFVITGSACILGHIFPFYMKFRGGKGLACLGGMVLAFDWRVFVVLLASELVMVLIVDYICFVPMSASPVFAVIYGIMTKDIIGTVILLLISLVIIFKHIENLRRIKKGTEARFSFLWNKDEKARLEKNVSKE